MRLTHLEIAHGHYFVRFSTDDDEVFARILTEFKGMIPRDERVYIPESKVWAIKGTETNRDALRSMFADFEKQAAFAQNQMYLLEQCKFGNPFESEVCREQAKP